MKLLRFRLLHSTLFRLAFFYAAFFCAAVILLLAFVYFATVREMEEQIRHHISVQMAQAQTAFATKGVPGVSKQVGDFLEEEEEGLALYLLVDPQNKPVAGNMENWPEDAEYNQKWLTFDIEGKRVEDDVHVLARDMLFPGGYRLLIGYSLRGPDRTRHVMLDVVTAGIFITFLITGLGGALFSSVIKKRLERVNQICAEVMRGSLDVAVPTTGGDDAFDHLADNVNAMLARIAQLVQGLRQTSDNIAHDLRTPLNRHRIRLEAMLQNPPPRERMQEDIKGAMEEIDNLVETLNSILRISQAQSGVASGHMTLFDFSSVLIDVVEFYAEFAEQKGIAMLDAIPPDITVRGDKPLLTQAVANLLDNAIKYTPAGGAIAVTLARHEQGVECMVADNGPGIPQEFYEKVRERFFRLEASRTSAGTGLGLSLVDAVANLHRGLLLFEDNRPGLRVRLVLPMPLTEASALPAA